MSQERRPKTIAQLNQELVKTSKALDKIASVSQNIGSILAEKRLTGLAGSEEYLDIAARLGTNVAQIRQRLRDNASPVLIERRNALLGQKPQLAKEALEKIREAVNQGLIPEMVLSEAQNSYSQIIGTQTEIPPQTTREAAATPSSVHVIPVVEQPSAPKAGPEYQETLPRLIVDQSKREIIINDRRIIIRGKLEWGVLERLLRTPQTDVPEKELTQVAKKAGSKQKYPASNTIAVLREHLETDPKNPKLIITVRNRANRTMRPDYRLEAILETDEGIVQHEFKKVLPEKTKRRELAWQHEFELPLPDNQVFKGQSQILEKALRALLGTSPDNPIAIVKLTEAVYGEYDLQAAKKVSTAISRLRKYLQPLGWQITQTLSKAERARHQLGQHYLEKITPATTAEEKPEPEAPVEKPARITKDDEIFKDLNPSEADILEWLLLTSKDAPCSIEELVSLTMQPGTPTNQAALEVNNALDKIKNLLANRNLTILQTSPEGSETTRFYLGQKKEEETLTRMVINPKTQEIELGGKVRKLRGILWSVFLHLAKNSQQGISSADLNQFARNSGSGIQVSPGSIIIGDLREIFEADRKNPQLFIAEGSGKDKSYRINAGIEFIEEEEIAEKPAEETSESTELVEMPPSEESVPIEIQPSQVGGNTGAEVIKVPYQPSPEEQRQPDETIILGFIVSYLLSHTRLYFDQIQGALATEIRKRPGPTRPYTKEEVKQKFFSGFQKMWEESFIPHLKKSWTPEDQELWSNVNLLIQRMANGSVEEFKRKIKSEVDKSARDFTSRH